MAEGKQKFDRPPVNARFIELHAAGMFDCDFCGQENFVRCITKHFSKEEATEMLRDAGEIEAFEDAPDLACVGRAYPVFVRCKRCGAWFCTVPDDLREQVLGEQKGD